MADRPPLAEQDPAFMTAMRAFMAVHVDEELEPEQENPDEYQERI